MRIFGFALGAAIVAALVFAGPTGIPQTAPIPGGICPTNTPMLESDFEVDCTFVWPGPSEPVQTVASGAGVVVAVLDGGFNTNHPVFAGRLHPSPFDAIDLDADPNDGGDGIDNDGDGYIDWGVGHGTFVSGMVLAAACDATILPIRVRDDEGLGTDAWLAAGILHAIQEGADVINLSVTAPGMSAELLDAIDLAKVNGIVIVASAGNDGLSSIDQLGHEAHIVVGSVDDADRIADFSNYEEHPPSLMVFAPGVDLYGCYGWPNHDAMAIWSGTSFSAGTVSGAVALVLELHPTFTDLEVLTVLEDSLAPIQDTLGQPVGWSGRVDLVEVVTH